MLKIILSGCNGTMGQVIKQFTKDDDSIEIVAGLDKFPEKYNNNFPVYENPRQCKEEADVIIDFSHYSAFREIITFAKQHKLPLVMATTGLSDKNEKQLQLLSKEIPIFRSANMSLGVNVVLDLIYRATKSLEDSFDIEIIEAHHNKKVDAPSGTALMLAHEIKSAKNETSHFIYGRHGKQERRNKNDIGIHAIRGGTIVGEHTIVYAGLDEIIEIKHTALSKNIFAAGAIKAAKYIADKENGLYDMKKLLNNE
ncbi:4-hydroxy-tetrahydrodipicolinate reductase [Garciella nitratireducens]|uniref:4-hydroxy-tetrahydrodipicolinate reductase n=1 Tax=Garciella nitratireducens TaxID=218205 RepID=UPI001BD48487|nr:4-hydroxy-tetrahydrodipicolinate reductase [Garciella nitratireducens]